MHFIRALAFAIVVASAAPAMAQSDARGTLLSISAQGVSEAAPDMATITVGVVTSARGARDAQAENSARMQALIDALRQQGLAERDIQSANVSVSPQYGRDDSRITGYEAANTVRARVRDLASMGRVLDAIVAAGGNTVRGIAFSHQDPDAQLDLARADAVAEARRRADFYAQTLGLRVHRVIAVAEPGTGGGGELLLASVQTVEHLLDEMPQFAPATPIQPGEIETRASVNVTFELR